MTRQPIKTNETESYELSDLVPAAAGIPVEYLADLPLCIQVKVQNHKIHEQFNRLRKIAFPPSLRNPCSRR
jgi:hypothetical protein